VHVAIGRQCGDDVLVDFAFGHDARLGLGLWYLREARSLTAGAEDGELAHAYALLALYFLSAYRLPADPRP